MRYFFADCELDTARHAFLRNGVAVPLEPQVFDLLALLAENPNRLVSKDEIVDRVWGGRIVSEATISSRISASSSTIRMSCAISGLLPCQRGCQGYCHGGATARPFVGEPADGQLRTLHHEVAGESRHDDRHQQFSSTNGHDAHSPTATFCRGGSSPVELEGPGPAYFSTPIFWSIAL